MLHAVETVEVHDEMLADLECSFLPFGFDEPFRMEAHHGKYFDECGFFTFWIETPWVSKTCPTYHKAVKWTRINFEIFTQSSVPRSSYIFVRLALVLAFHENFFVPPHPNSSISKGAISCFVIIRWQ